MDEYFNDFEFERRFYCEEFPEKYHDNFPPHLIIQSYFLAKDGYAIRVRLQSSSLKIKMTSNTDPLEIIYNYPDAWDFAFMTVKGPSVGGTRYEVETVIDIDMAKELIKRGEKVIVKNRYSVWISKDGWSVDIFSGENTGLIIAECERLSPVTDLEIPSFCLKEVTDDKRFSNDELVNNPFQKWADVYKSELKKLVKDSPEKIYSNQFGQNTVLQ